MLLPYSFENVSYREGLLRMEALQVKRESRILFFEHPDTLTLGKTTKPGDLLESKESLNQKGYEIVCVKRGGRATYHGPGQLIAYPIFPLRGKGIGVRRFVEAVSIGVQNYLSSLGVLSEFLENSPGLFVDNKKLASFGFSVQHGYSGHGFALNLCCDLQKFQVIRPCGQEANVTSIKALQNSSLSPKEAVPELAYFLSKSLLRIPK